MPGRPLKLNIGVQESVSLQSPELKISENTKVTSSGMESEGKKKVYSFDDFETVRALGRGQFGTVDLIRDRSTGQLLAKKVIPIPAEEAQKKQLVREVNTMKNVKSAYCVKLYAAYISECRLNIVMEYMDMGTLHDLLRKPGKPMLVAEKVVRCIAYDLFKGLDYLHNQVAIIHRDIKPLNVLVSSKGIMKISDFGLAARLEGTIKATATFVGTTIYMSPERLRGEEYTMTSDVWSMGLVVAECLLGQHPFMMGKDIDSASKGGVFFGLLEQISKADPVERLKDLPLSKECVDFLTRTLDRNATLRLTSQQAVEHPWFKDVARREEYRKATIMRWIGELHEIKREIDEGKK